MPRGTVFIRKETLLTEFLQHGVAVQLRHGVDEVLCQQSMNMLGGVHRVPEDVLVGVGTKRVVVPACQTAQERWSLVAVSHGVCEAQLQQQ